MASKQFTKILVAVSAAGIVAVGGMVMLSKAAHAQDPTSLSQIVQIGLDIAPVKLNLTGKDPTLVGLGSFIVNAQADCNGCHTSNPTGSEYGSTNNPFLLTPPTYPPKVDAQYYLGGGQNFGPAGAGVVSPSSPYYAGPGNGPLIISRNLTPDYTGLPEGGHTLQQFLTIIQTGHDYDNLHPNCSTKVTTNCYYAPTNGAVLQVMPWAVFANMTEYQLTAIWTYLSAIPCIANTNSPYTNLINVCPSH
jgi:hypothetical protein